MAFVIWHPIRREAQPFGVAGHDCGISSGVRLNTKDAHFHEYSLFCITGRDSHDLAPVVERVAFAPKMYLGHVVSFQMRNIEIRKLRSTKRTVTVAPKPAY